MCNCGDFLKVFECALVAGCGYLVAWIVAKPLIEKVVEKVKFW